jgi:hypothetical protein
MHADGKNVSDSDVVELHKLVEHDKKKWPHFAKEELFNSILLKYGKDQTLVPLNIMTLLHPSCLFLDM